MKILNKPGIVLSPFFWKYFLISTIFLLFLVFFLMQQTCGLIQSYTSIAGEYVLSTVDDTFFADDLIKKQEVCAHLGISYIKKANSNVKIPYTEYLSGRIEYISGEYLILFENPPFLQEAWRKSIINIIVIAIFYGLTIAIGIIIDKRFIIRPYTALHGDLKKHLSNDPITPIPMHPQRFTAQIASQINECIYKQLVVREKFDVFFLQLQKYVTNLRKKSLSSLESSKTFHTETILPEFSELRSCLRSLGEMHAIIVQSNQLIELIFRTSKISRSVRKQFDEYLKKAHNSMSTLQENKKHISKAMQRLSDSNTTYLGKLQTVTLETSDLVTSFTHHRSKIAKIKEMSNKARLLSINVSIELSRDTPNVESLSYTLNEMQANMREVSLQSQHMNIEMESQRILLEKIHTMCSDSKLKNNKDSENLEGFSKSEAKYQKLIDDFVLTFKYLQSTLDDLLQLDKNLEHTDTELSAHQANMSSQYKTLNTSLGLLEDRVSVSLKESKEQTNSLEESSRTLMSLQNDMRTMNDFLGFSDEVKETQQPIPKKSKNKSSQASAQKHPT